ncbi:DUF3048 domain-containing protein [Candidatus Uhrbacteria bacterium]|nr:DUF3048 domain-containing protein [Candidatus Uhrbacteria bacterium]
MVEIRRHRWFRGRFPWQGVVFLLCLIVIAGASMWFGALFFRASGVQSAEIPQVQVRRALDGVWVEPEEQSYLPVGVMIENMIDSRPASGIARAQLVVEAPVEAGITRFLAVYAVRDVGSEIGPVRSLRPYYLAWAKEIGAALVHVGGSPEAMARVRKEYARLNVDQFYEAGSFWRTKARQAPHNVYTTLPLIRELLTNRSIGDTSTFPQWVFEDDPPLAARPEGADHLSLSFSTDPYRVVWEYDRATNAYRRFHGSVPHADVDGGVVLAKNIIVIPTRVQILDAIGRRAITLLGSGKAILFRNGLRMDARWVKEKPDDRLTLVSVDGAPIPLTAGTTWIEVFPMTGAMVYNDVKEVLNK